MNLVPALAFLLAAFSAQDAQDPARVHVELYKKVSPAVVAVRQAGRTASGIIIDKSGLLLTSSLTVVDEDKEVKVNRPGFKVEKATVVGRVPELELAILRLPGVDYPVAELGDSDQADVGKVAYVLGDSFGSLVGDGQPAISAGVISGRLKLDQAGGKFKYTGPVLETSAAVNPGQAGAPLLDGRGRVVGLVTMKYIDGRFTGLAIPINAMKVAVRRALEGRPVDADDEEAWIAAELDVKDGALVVAQVFAGGAAEKAGLEKGDRILSIKSGDVFTNVGTAAEIRKRIDSLKTGQSLTLHVRRGSDEHDATVTAEAKETY